jgi:putative transposase
MLPLTNEQRDALLTIYRKDPDPELRFRSHIILLLGEGHRWDTIEAMLFCSSRTVDRWLTSSDKTVWHQFCAMGW